MSKKISQLDPAPLPLNGGSRFPLVQAGVTYNTTLSSLSSFIGNGIVSGLGTMAFQQSNNVNITGGTITGITDLAVVDGGTGSSTVSGARTNLGIGAVGTLSGTTAVRNWIQNPTSANLRTAVATTNTGTGALVFADSPSLIDPDIGDATGSSLNVTGAIDGGALDIDGGSNLRGIQMITPGSVNNASITYLGGYIGVPYIEYYNDGIPETKWGIGQSHPKHMQNYMPKQAGDFWTWHCQGALQTGLTNVMDPAWHLMSLSAVEDPTNPFILAPKLSIGNLQQADPSAIVDIHSSNVGVLLPRLENSAKLSIPSPANGLLVYDEGTNEMNVWNGTKWVPFADADTLFTVATTYATTAPNNTNVYDSINIYSEEGVYSTSYKSLSSLFYTWNNSTNLMTIPSLDGKRIKSNNLSATSFLLSGGAVNPGWSCVLFWETGARPSLSAVGSSTIQSAVSSFPIIASIVSSVVITYEGSNKFTVEGNIA